MSKVSVVTGGNKGVGFGIVRALCKQVGGTVILTARNEERGLAAVQKLKDEGLEVQFEQLDITCKDSVTRFKDIVSSKYGGIDILCNNAGIAYKVASTAPLLEKATITNGTNFIARIESTHALLPIIKDNGKICQISAFNGTLNRTFPDPNNPIRKRLTDPKLSVMELLEIYQEYIKSVENDDYSLFKRDAAYSMSKCFLTIHTRIMGDTLATDPRKILINCCCPGSVQTDMSSHKGNLTIDEGSATPVFVCQLPSGSSNGGFYRESRLYDWVNDCYL